MAMKIDLEEWFDYVILMRGKEYFLDDRVIDLKKTVWYNSYHEMAIKLPKRFYF